MSVLRRMAALALLPVGSLGAQLVVNTTSGEAQLDQLPSSAITSLGATVTHRFSFFRLGLDGRIAELREVGRTGDVATSFRWVAAPRGWRLEAGPLFRAGRGIGERWTAIGGGELRLGRQIRGLAVDAGLRQGIARIAGQTTGWGAYDLRAAVSSGDFSFAVDYTGTAVRDSVVRGGVFFDPRDPRADTLYTSRIRTFRDASFTGAWGTRTTQVSARLGWRSGAGVRNQTWWIGNAAFRILPAVSATMSYGRTPSDPLLGMRGGEHTTIGLRLDLPSHRAIARDYREHLEPDAFQPLVEVSREDASRVRVRLVLPNTRRSAVLTGDITDWEPVALTRTEDGRWEAWLTAPKGTYRVNVKLDGGTWIAPPGMTVMDDGFGGKVGLLVL